MPDRIIRGINGPRGSVLLAAAWVCALHGIAYTPLTSGPIELPVGLAALSEVLPLVAYGVLWSIAACITILGAFRSRAGAQRDHADAWGFGAATGMFLAWGLAYVSGWIIATMDGIPSRSWVTGGLYIAVAVIVAASARMTNPTARQVRP